MIFWIKTASAFIFRSSRTTLALGCLICVALATLVFISAIATGVNDCMVKNSTGLYTGHIMGEGLPRDLKPGELKIPGVDQVLRRLALPASLSPPSGGPLVPDLQVRLVGVSPSREKAAAALWKKVIRGGFLVPGHRGILISAEMEKRLSVRVGDRLTVNTGGVTMELPVQGIYETGISAMDQAFAFCPVSSLVSSPMTWHAAVFLQPGVSEEAVRKIWADKGIDPSLFKTWREAMPGLTQLIDLNRLSMGFVMVLVLGVVAFATACAFAIFIISRLREYGIMKTMGVTPGEMTVMILSQVILLNFISAVIGLFAGAAAVTLFARTGIDLSGFTSHNPYFVVSGVIVPRLTPFSLLLPPLLSLCLCMVAAIWPVVVVIRQRPADILRSI